MTEHESDNMPQELETLFRAERSRPDPSPADAEEVLERLTITLGGGLLASGQPSGNGVNGPAAAASASPASGVVGTVLAHPIRLALATFVLGAGAGAGIHAVVAPRVESPAPVVAPRASSVQQPVASVPPEIPPAKPPEVQHRPVPAVAPAPKRISRSAPPTPKPTETTPRDADLRAERDLVEMARNSLVRGKSAPALAALESHAKRFPLGRLAEERESLWVQALITAGDRKAAQAQAEAFRKQFPSSIFIPAIDAALMEQAPR